MRFVDTDVLLYSVSRAPEERDKAAIAREILQRRDLALSVQVLQEFYVQAIRQTRPDRLRHDQAVRLVESFCRYPVQELTLAVVRAAFVTRARWQLSYWDAAILRAARTSGCEVVLSEDLSGWEDYESFRVENLLGHYQNEATSLGFEHFSTEDSKIGARIQVGAKDHKVRCGRPGRGYKHSVVAEPFYSAANHLASSIIVLLEGLTIDSEDLKLGWAS